MTSIRRASCRHRVLMFVGRNDGVVCCACGRAWRRVIRYVGNTRISRLVGR